MRLELQYLISITSISTRLRQAAFG